MHAAFTVSFSTEKCKCHDRRLSYRVSGVVLGPVGATEVDSGLSQSHVVVDVLIDVDLTRNINFFSLLFICSDITSKRGASRVLPIM